MTPVLGDERQYRAVGIGVAHALDLALHHQRAERLAMAQHRRAEPVEATRRR